jgi:hypothetical protein
MEIRVGQPRSVGGTTTRSNHRCPQCRTEALVMRRRHLSSPGWGEPMLTEYYDCDYCDARFSYSPGDGRWKILAD